MDHNSPHLSLVDRCTHQQTQPREGEVGSLVVVAVGTLEVETIIMVGPRWFLQVQTLFSTMSVVWENKAPDLQVLQEI
jgi:hypothetical protein